MAAPVIDEGARLAGKLAETFVGGPMWSTTILTTGAGAEQRFKRWVQPRYRYQIDQPPMNLAMAQALEAFLVARDGQFQGFRFEDYADYQISFPADTVQLTATTFQIAKSYTSGSVTRIRTIYKPVSGTVAVFNTSNVVVPSGWTVNTTTGIVTFSAAPGYLPRATCSFDVPVRLDTSQLQRNMLGPQNLEVRGLALLELR